MENRLRKLREEKRLTQAALAREADVSRQALHAMESGRSTPGVDVALALARALDTTVEALFGAPAGAARVQAQWTRSTPSRAGRVTLAQVDGQWVAHALSASDAQQADGAVISTRGRSVTVEPFDALERARRRLLVMGCAPALGLLSSRLELPMTWLSGGSRAALDALAHGDVHVAGIHSGSAVTSAEMVRRALPQVKTTCLTLAGWELGLVVSERNRRRIRSVDDLGRRGVRVAVREPGAGARSLLERELHRLGRSVKELTRPLEVTSHLEVAARVSLGLADTGITIGAAAVAHGLHFIPLVEERFELIIPEALQRDERVQRLGDVVSGRAFRSELSSLGGYLTEMCGETR